MKKGILSGDIYVGISGIVASTDCFDYEHLNILSGGEFYLVRIDSASPVKQLVVPANFILEEGERIWAYFEKENLVPEKSELIRKLHGVEIPDIIKTQSGNYPSDTCHITPDMLQRIFK